MSGLFLNFFQVELSEDYVSIDTVDYQNYSSQEAFKELQKKNPDLFFYRLNDKIIIWNRLGKNNVFNGSRRVEFYLTENPKILSKLLEVALIEYFRVRLSKYKIVKNKHSHTWELISPSDILDGKIPGLVVNRIVHFSPCFFYREGKLLFGFSLSISLKNSFTWSKNDFEKYGIDMAGLKGNEDSIFANKQAISRFLSTTGNTLSYDKYINAENENYNRFKVISKFYNWLLDKKAEIPLPFDLKVVNISKKYLPIENNLIKSDIIFKPQRYFYSNRKNSDNLRFYDEMVRKYQPYSLELYQNKNITIGVVCPKEYQGETEGFIKKIEAKLKEDFHFNSLSFHLKIIPNIDLESYKTVLYDQDLLTSDMIYVVVSEVHEKLKPSLSPYFLCKAKFIGNGIPTQDIQIETIRLNLTKPTMTNIALNTYAKLGGTAWTIEKEDKLRDELIIGVGSTVSDDNRHVLGIAQIFHNDGRYLTGDCSPLSTFDNYAENLEEHLYNTLKPLADSMSKSGTFRLIFHLFKSASDEYEIKAINSLKKRLDDYNFEFALVHLGYGHNYRLYYNDGRNDVAQGTYIQLSRYSALLNFVKDSDLPLKIDLDSRSTFISLFYLAKQIYWFSHLSHRSYIPAKRTVTIMYPSLMSKMTEELKKVENWDLDRLKAVSEKLWFI
jgi:hypothetical protein